MDIDEDKPQTVEESLKDHFGGVVETPEVMAACISMCKIYNMEPQDLYYNWEAFSYSANNTKSISRLTPEHIQAFREYLQREFKQSNAAAGNIGTPMRPTATPSAKMTAAKSALANRIMAQATPTAKNLALNRVADGASSGSPAPSSRLMKPIGALNLASSSGTTKNRIIVPKNIADYSYRYMYEKIHERSNALDNRINDVAELVKDFYNIQDDFSDPNADTEEDVVVVGRICDSSADGKLTESSIILEPSKWMGSGRRIPIQFASSVLRMYRDTPPAGSERSGIGLFPGAIAAFKGCKAHSQEGGFFMVKEILPLPPPKLPSSRPAKGAMSFSALVASGPFTFDSDLNYSPFQAVLDAIRKLKPASVILLGPFVDSNHPTVREGDVENSSDFIFVKKIGQPLRDLLSEEGFQHISVGFVPSVRDMVTNRNVFPQGAGIGPPKFQNWPVATFLPNPCTFSLNGVTIGVSTVDVLFHLRKSEVYKSIANGGPQTDPMADLCRHILDQRSFYPLFPVPKDVSADVNLDLSHSNLLSLEDIAPDVIVLPSRLKEFTKVIEGTVFINPSSASKFNGNGMIARITVNAMGEGSERISVDIVRL